VSEPPRGAGPPSHYGSGVEQVLTAFLSFGFGITTALLVEWLIRPRVERRRRQEERWENELQQLIELLETRLPRLADELNLRLEVGTMWPEEIQNREHLTPQQHDVLGQMFHQDRESVQRAYEAWEEVAQFAAVLTRRVARFRLAESMTGQEVSGKLYSFLYATEVSDFRRGRNPSGNYRQREKELRERLLKWAEAQLRDGKPLRREWWRWVQVPRGRTLGLLVFVSFLLFVVILNLALG
jgi:hypothetical protein